jgi:hypothetical protein
MRPKKENAAGLLLFDIVLSAEPLDAAGGIHQFLFSGKERMAGGTYFHLKILYGRTGFNHISAGAGNLSHLVPGMNFFSHNNSPSGFVQLPGGFKDS